MSLLKNYFCLTLVAVALLTGKDSSANQHETSFVVSRSGNDRNPGTFEKPFATLERAREAIRILKTQKGLPLGGVTVYIRGGNYLLSTPLQLSELDSGTPNAPITYRAFKNEDVHLIGGKEVTGFVPVNDPNVLNRIDLAARAHVVQVDLRRLGISDFGDIKVRGFGKTGIPSALQLFFNGTPMTLARWPNHDWAKIVATPAGLGGDRFTYDGNRPNGWGKNDDIWLHGYWNWDWADSYVKLSSINLPLHEIVTQYPHGVYGYKVGGRYYALNILEELDEPGEWYLDRRKGILYFWPPGTLVQGKCFVSILPAVLAMTNTSCVTVQGIAIEYSRGTGVTIKGGDGNRIVNCTVRNVGTDAIKIDGGKGNGVIGSDIYNCGESGVTIAGGDRKKLIAAGNYAVNNRIHDYSQWVRTYIPGIGINGVGNRAANNLIYNAPHTAILLHGNDHLVEYNEVHHVCLETHDSGAFYMGRDYSERGNVIRFNYFHDLNSTDVQAIYLDDFASGALVYGNVVYKSTRGVKIGGGRDNTIRNNIFVDCKEAIQVDARGTSWAKKFFSGADKTLYNRLKAVNYKQPPYSVKYPELLLAYDRDPAVPEGNVIDSNVAYKGRFVTLKDGLNDRVIKIERNLVNVDPRFIDIAHGNFVLSKDSPAFRLGFQPIPFDRIGLYHDQYRK